ncbi:uncharacterized protein VICG_01942 [Vittaforma corneae ATCC 50505]|uniref:U2A'/phosphoprotein 32 family A C-terminal domain-containing protein n=1 Tax=Vittaforma corneae (strain ATCC 50505) TaxID=993615 RepID=L2GKM9_VITCO|nr:uncharacterized protein VICG_01942 [Vittaforma corneae ATCC 50505]ELA41060.1 hypothetical protein VICG_01942 [Vittaforma corneae ATCC 50505]
MNHPEISEIINEYFGYLNLAQHEDYLSNKADIHEVVAKRLYNYCTLVIYDGPLNEDGSPKEEAVQKSKTYLWGSKLYSIEVSGLRCDCVPIKALRFLADQCGTRNLAISNATIDIAALNSPDFSKITVLSLAYVRLTKMPCLHNLTGLEYLYLNDNEIEHVSFQSYFDAKTDTYRTMPNLKRLILCRNPISSIDARIQKVFPNPSMKIGLDKLYLRYPFSNMKDELQKVCIQLVEPGEKKENESEVKN